MGQGMQQEGSLFAQIDYMIRNRQTSLPMTLTFGSGSAAKVKLTNTVNYILNGVVQTPVTTAEFVVAVPTNYGTAVGTGILPATRFDLALASPSQSLPASLQTIPISSWQRYLVVMDAAGAVWTLPSPIGLSSASAAPDAPPVPIGYVVLGDVTIKTDGSHTFIPATTAFNAAGITSVFRELYWPDTGLSAIKDARTTYAL